MKFDPVIMCIGDFKVKVAEDFDDTALRPLLKKANSFFKPPGTFKGWTDESVAAECHAAFALGAALAQKPGTVTVDKEEYEELKDEVLFLECLRGAGVDNWDWYGEAIEEYLRLKGTDA